MVGGWAADGILIRGQFKQGANAVCGQQSSAHRILTYRGNVR